MVDSFMDKIPAMYFRGSSSSYVHVNDTNFPYGSSDRTLSWWFKMDNYSIQDDGCFILYGTANSYQNFNMAINSTRKMKYDIWNFDIKGNISISPNQWYYACCVIKQKVVYGYINGVLDVSGSVSNINTTKGTGLCAMGIRFTNSQPYKGYMSSVRIYNRAL